MCLSVYSTVCQWGHSSICPFSVCPSVHMSVIRCVRSSGHPSICPSVCLSLRQSDCPSVCQYVSPTVRLFVCQDHYLCDCQSVCVPHCLFPSKDSKDVRFDQQTGPPMKQVMHRMTLRSSQDHTYIYIYIIYIYTYIYIYTCIYIYIHSESENCSVHLVLAVTFCILDAEN